MEIDADASANAPKDMVIGSVWDVGRRFPVSWVEIGKLS